MLLSGTLFDLAAMQDESAYGAASTTSPTNEEFIDFIAGAWNSTYATRSNVAGASAVGDPLSLFTLSTETAGQITINAKSGSGRRGFNKSYILIITASTTMSSAVYGLSYGATTDPSDNNTISGGIVVTVEAQTGGSLLDETNGLVFQSSADDVDAATANRIELLSTTLLLNSTPQVATTTAENIYPRDARGDAGNREGAVAKNVTTAAVSFNRVSWL